jgi:hypothetical protein
MKKANRKWKRCNENACAHHEDNAVLQNPMLIFRATCRNLAPALGASETVRDVAN